MLATVVAASAGSCAALQPVWQHHTAFGLHVQRGQQQPPTGSACSALGRQSCTARAWRMMRCAVPLTRQGAATAASPPTMPVVLCQKDKAPGEQPKWNLPKPRGSRKADPAPEPPTQEDAKPEDVPEAYSTLSQQLRRALGDAYPKRTGSSDPPPALTVSQPAKRKLLHPKLWQRT